MFGTIFRLEWGVIDNSNNGKKNQGKILEIKYNEVKWAGALAMGDLPEVTVFTTSSPQLEKNFAKYFLGLQRRVIEVSMALEC